MRLGRVARIQPVRTNIPEIKPHAAQSPEVFVAYAAACSITTSAPAPHRRLAVGQTVYLSQEQALGLTEVRSQDERGILGRDGPVAKVSGAALIIARARGTVGAEAAAQSSV